MILSDLIDLIVCCFKHSGDLGELGHLRQAGKLVGGHHQIGAWSLEDVMAVNAEKLFVEVTMEQPSLRVELVVASSLGHRKGVLIFAVLHAIDVPVFMSGAFLIGFAVPGGRSMLMLKITPPRKGGRGGCSVKVSARVSVEPWDSESGFSSRMVRRDAPGPRLACSMLTIGGS